MGFAPVESTKGRWKVFEKKLVCVLKICGRFTLFFEESLSIILCVSPACIFVACICSAHGGQMRALDLLALELQANHHRYTGTQTQFLYKNT